MKTHKELLDFFEVELDKIYQIKDDIAFFKVMLNDYGKPMVYYSINPELLKKGKSAIYDLLKLQDWDYEECKRPILDKKEHEYLSFVIRPFRKNIVTICKDAYGEDEYIKIVFDKYDNIDFPVFKKGLMYKGMELKKCYTLEELGL